MSEREYQRRKLTGTLTSCTVTASVAALGLGGDTFMHAGDTKTKRVLEKEVTEFHTELSSKFFQAPAQVIIPTSVNRKSGEFNSGPQSVTNVASYQEYPLGRFDWWVLRIKGRCYSALLVWEIGFTSFTKSNVTTKLYVHCEEITPSESNA